MLVAHWQLSERLPNHLIKEPIQVVGEIIDLPDKQGKNWRFNFSIRQALHNSKPIEVPEKVRLSWYRTEQQLSSGQTWQFQVKLKPPSGLRNFGLFDLEGWYFQHNIRATGYIVKSEDNRMVQEPGWFGFDVWREKIRAKLAEFNRHSPDSDDSYSDDSYGSKNDSPEDNSGHYSGALAMTMALTLGDKSQISQQHWEMFQRLGINHLVAISGLHIGMIALLAYGVSGRLWRLSARLCERIAAPQVQAVSALVFAFGYAGLAGFSLPTQRALIMLSVVLVSRILLVNIQPYRQLFLALFVVLVWQPSAISSAGFWLSFTAVAAIFYVLHFSEQSNNKLAFLSNLVKMQLLITIAMVPLTLLFFQQVSLVSPVVNLVLIPVFSFLVVPAALASALLAFIDHQTTRVFIEYYLHALQLLLDVLANFSGSESLAFKVYDFSMLQYLLVFMAAATFFIRINVFLKISLWLLLIIVFPFSTNIPAPGSLQLTVLDVGQGSAYLIKKNDRVLVYDLGPRYSGGSATRSVLIPYLQNQGISKIDLLVISHADSDHAGDIRALKSQFEIGRIFVGEPVRYLDQTQSCHHVSRWNWSGTEFRFLTVANQASETGNNASCVLQVSHHGFQALLTGDIEKKIERQLVSEYAKQLKSELVLVPHHGSRSSSTRDFVTHVDPEWVINSSGYLNRYRFPADSVKLRWTQNNARFLDTATHGSIEFIIDAAGNLAGQRTFHDNQKKYWHENRLADRPG